MIFEHALRPGTLQLGHLAEAVELQGGPHPCEQLPPADLALYVPDVFAHIVGKKAKILQEHILIYFNQFPAYLKYIQELDLCFEYPNQQRIKPVHYVYDEDMWKYSSNAVRYPMWQLIPLLYFANYRHTF